MIYDKRKREEMIQKSLLKISKRVFKVATGIRYQREKLSGGVIFVHKYNSGRMAIKIRGFGRKEEKMREWRFGRVHRMICGFKSCSLK